MYFRISCTAIYFFSYGLNFAGWPMRSLFLSGAAIYAKFETKQSKAMCISKTMWNLDFKVGDRMPRVAFATCDLKLSLPDGMSKVVYGTRKNSISLQF